MHPGEIGIGKPSPRAKRLIVANTRGASSHRQGPVEPSSRLGGEDAASARATQGTSGLSIAGIPTRDDLGRVGSKSGQNDEATPRTLFLPMCNEAGPCVKALQANGAHPIRVGPSATPANRSMGAKGVHGQGLPRPEGRIASGAPEHITKLANPAGPIPRTECGLMDS